MADVANWIDNPLAWNTVYIGLAELPGIATVRRIKCGPKFDKQRRRGGDGLKLKDDGMKPAEFTIELWFTGAEWSRWLAILPMIHTLKPGNERSPKSIVHPLPNHMGITQVYVKSVEVEQPSAGKGCKAVIEVEQWFDEVKDKNTKTKVEKSYPPLNPKRLSDALTHQGAFVPGAPEGLDAIEQGLYRVNRTGGGRN